MRFLPLSLLPAHLLLFVVFAALASLPLPQSLAQTTTDTVYRLHGSVLDGITGRPIGRALVVSGDRRLATMSDSEGNWALDVSVPAAAAAPSEASVRNGIPRSLRGGSGSVSLQAQRPGYLFPHGESSVPLTAEATQSAVTLKLYAAAQIRGSVQVGALVGGQAAGQPAGQGRLRGLRVTLLRRGVYDGRSVWMQAGGRAVEPDGSFRFPDLQPGQYTVATGEWDPAQDGSSSQPAVTQQYPPVFLGNVSRLSAATKLHLGYGQVGQALLLPRPAPYYAIQVPVQATSQNAAVNLRVTNGEVFSGYELGWDARASQVQGALPDGDYVLHINSFANPHGSASVPLHVGGAPVRMAAVVLAPTQDIAVRVHDERTNAAKTDAAPRVSNLRGLSQDFGLYLQPENPADGSPGGVAQQKDGAYTVQNILPGTYRVQVNAWRGYVATLTSGRTDLLRQPLTVSNTGADPIELTLRDDVGTVRGNVVQAEASTEPAIVLLLPTDGSMQVVHAATGRADSQFVAGNVAPGTYRALAFAAEEFREGVPYRDEETQRALQSQGTLVTVSPGQTATVTIPMQPVSPGGVLP